MSRKIVFLDDDPHAIGSYAVELRREGYAPAIASETDEIAAVVAGSLHADADLFIIDMMMPSRGLYADDVSESGLRTGLLVARDIRNRTPNIPIILWSAAAFHDLQAVAKRGSKRIPHCIFLRKSMLQQHELASIVNDYFRTGKFTRGVFMRLWDAVSIRPSIGGVSVDIKRLKE